MTPGQDILVQPQVKVYDDNSHHLPLNCPCYARNWVNCPGSHPTERGFSTSDSIRVSDRGCLLPDLTVCITKVSIWSSLELDPLMAKFALNWILQDFSFNANAQLIHTVPIASYLSLSKLVAFQNNFQWK